MKANFVLWSDGLDFYVSERTGVKSDSSNRIHFVEFFETEKAAYAEAERRTKDRIETLQSYIKRYRRNSKKGMAYG